MIIKLKYLEDVVLIIFNGNFVNIVYIQFLLNVLNVETVLSIKDYKLFSKIIILEK